MEVVSEYAAGLKARQTKYAAYVTVYIVVMLAIVTVANVLANRYNKSYDSTSNKRYSLSDQTAKIVKGLKQDATITYFDQATRFQPAKDLLDRYATLSPKVHVDYVDPDKNPQVARAAGITNYGTTIVQIGAKKEEAKSITEEDITGAFIRDLKQTTRTVCFVTGSGEHQIDDTTRRRLFTLQGRARQGRLPGEVHQPAGKGRSPGRLHGGRGGRARTAITSSRKSMPSRNTWRTAGARCSCWIRR